MAKDKTHKNKYHRDWQRKRRGTGLPSEDEMKKYAQCPDCRLWFYAHSNGKPHKHDCDGLDDTPLDEIDEQYKIEALDEYGIENRNATRRAFIKNCNTQFDWRTK